MDIAGHIRYLKRSEIDTSKWDERIMLATNGVVYAYSFYLDAMSDDWDALVLDEYQYVMPLPFRKKIGIAYIYQPFLTPQLGIFGDHPELALLHRFLQAIPAHFKFWD